jgi:poly-D-alanine transfer protein DltD
MKFSTSLFIAISALCFSTTLAAPVGLGLQAQVNSQHDTQVLTKRSPNWFQEKAKKVKEAAAFATANALKQVKKTTKAISNNETFQKATERVKNAGEKLAETKLGKKAIRSVAAIKANDHVVNAGNKLNEKMASAKNAWEGLDSDDETENSDDDEAAIPLLAQ